MTGPLTPTERRTFTVTEYTSANIWQDWFPEEALADLLAGRAVETNIGQVKGAWKRALAHEVKAGRLVTWQGHWYPVPGAPWGLGPLKTCYGTPEIAAYFAAAKADATGGLK